jgi:undecaprenyl-diphosphatase
MDYFYALILGVIQGLTEFLPISSTAHLILGERLFGLDPEVFGLSFDAAIQLGTTVAVTYFFRADLYQLLRNFREPAQQRLFIALIVATIPALLFGVSLEHYISTSFRRLEVIATTLIVGAFLFFLIERLAKARKTAEQSTWFDALMIGLAQSLALVPGVSRSGATIVAGMALGLERAAAARFTFLLSIPIITIAGLKKLLDVAQGGAGGRLDLIAVGLITAAIVGYLTIKYLLRFLAHHRLDVFAYYRLLIGGSIVLVLLS